MSTPDPDFVKWFGGDFQRRLEATVVPGMADASWDRKAAWLLWCAEHRRGVWDGKTIQPLPTGGLFD
jgi:hypothetical protein